MASLVQQEAGGPSTVNDCSDDRVMMARAKNDLQDSEMTGHTEGGSLSENEAGGWLGAIGSDFRNIASCFKDNIPPVIGGVASLVHQTALSVAAEIAQLERDGELEAERWNTDHSIDVLDKNSGPLSLPWEMRQDLACAESSVYIADDELQATILNLSRREDTFRGPYTPSVSEFSEQVPQFELDEQRIVLIRRLLDIDDNLAAMHARLSGRSNVRETAFWRNYFHHCEEARVDHVERKLKQQKKMNAEPSLLENQHFRPNPPENKAFDQMMFFDGPCADDPDDSSLIPASVTDDSSYVNVIPSAPNSYNTFATTRSLDDLVLVDCEGQESD